MRAYFLIYACELLTRETAKDFGKAVMTSSVISLAMTGAVRPGLIALSTAVYTADSVAKRTKQLIQYRSIGL